MKVHRPTYVVFVISTILAVLAIISQYIGKVPIVGGNEFLVLMLAFILLWLGVVLRGL